jgi:hypothetical protein
MISDRRQPTFDCCARSRSVHAIALVQSAQSRTSRGAPFTNHRARAPVVIGSISACAQRPSACRILNMTVGVGDVGWGVDQRRPRKRLTDLNVLVA